MPGFLKSIVADARPRTTPAADGAPGEAGPGNNPVNPSLAQVRTNAEPNGMKNAAGRITAPVDNRYLAEPKTNIDRPAGAGITNNTHNEQVLESEQTKTAEQDPMPEPAVDEIKPASRHPRQPVPATAKLQPEIQKTKAPEANARQGFRQVETAAPLADQPQHFPYPDGAPGVPVAHPPTARGADTGQMKPTAKAVRPASAEAAETTMMNESLPEKFLMEIPAARQTAGQDPQNTDQPGIKTIGSFEMERNVVLQADEPAATGNADQAGVTDTGSNLRQRIDYPPQETDHDKRDPVASSGGSGAGVHIGQIDIIVKSERGNAIPRHKEQTGLSDFSSRHYLRRLT